MVMTSVIWMMISHPCKCTIELSSESSFLRGSNEFKLVLELIHDIMIKYSFAAKRATNLFDDIEFIVPNGHGCFTEEIDPKDCSVIQMFDNKALFVAIPAKLFPDVHFHTYPDCLGGKIIYNNRKFGFSLHGNVLYILKN